MNIRIINNHFDVTWSDQTNMYDIDYCLNGCFLTLTGDRLWRRRHGRVGNDGQAIEKSGCHQHQQ